MNRFCAIRLFSIAPNGTWAIGLGSFISPQGATDSVALFGPPTTGLQTPTQTFRIELVNVLTAGPAIALSNDKVFSVRQLFGERFAAIYHPSVVFVNSISSGAQLQAIQFTTSYPAGMPPSFPDLTQLQIPTDIANDAADLIYVSNLQGCGGSGSVTVYAADANGNVAPIRVLGGSGSGVAAPNGIAIGPSSAGLAH